MLPPFLKAVPLLKKIETNGYEAYFVGGSVRDSILGRKITDVDIATSAFPEEVKEIFSNTVDLGIEHGTILVIFEGTPYEITTFRSESGYSDFRRPDKVEFIRSLTEDLKRRDFTMNAIAMDRSGKLIDPFGGYDAIQEQQIITVGDSQERFSEDALRMMRAVRFVSQLGFAIEEKTLLGLKKLAHFLDKIAVERKLTEFEKMLAGPYRKEALRLLTEAKLNHYLPGLNGNDDALLKLSQSAKFELLLEEMWTLLIFYMGLSENEAAKFLRGWKLPVKKIKQCLTYLHYLHFRLGDRWSALTAYQSGKDTMLAVERVFECLSREDPIPETKLVDLFEALPIKSRSDLKINGNDLLLWTGQKPGPWIKGYLSKIEEMVITGMLENDKTDIRRWLTITCNPK